VGAVLADRRSRPRHLRALACQLPHARRPRRDRRTAHVDLRAPARPADLLLPVLLQPRARFAHGRSAQDARGALAAPPARKVPVGGAGPGSRGVLLRRRRLDRAHPRAARARRRGRRRRLCLHDQRLPEHGRRARVHAADGQLAPERRSA
jgi:hypothetical protein